ncbi:MAG: 30S ribosomal protein S17e [Candidatus Aenigmatarchaeota archaeon]
MGRIRTLLIKKIAEKLVREHKDKLSDSFEKNKEILKSLIQIRSKKIRNKAAGYITKLVKLSKSSSSS